MCGVHVAFQRLRVIGSHYSDVTTVSSEIKPTIRDHDQWLDYELVDYSQLSFYILHYLCTL